MDMKSMAVVMPEVKGHPNRIAFEGVLTMVDIPSHKPPSGSKGHRVILTKRAAEAALPSLLGMAVDYSPTLDKHDVRCKVGVITRADIVGKNIEIGGHLFARDFPEIVGEIAKSDDVSGRVRASYLGADISSAGAMTEEPGRAVSIHAVADGGRQNSFTNRAGLRTSLRLAAAQLLSLTESLRGNVKPRTRGGELAIIRAETQISSGSQGLGMSYEVANVHLEDASAKVWVLDKVTFTGAAILLRDKAAYRDTWIQLV